MSESPFRKVIVIGYGVVTGNVLKHIFQKKDEYGYSVSYIEHEPYPFNLAKKFADSEKIESFSVENKDKLLKHFNESVKDSKTLIVSASNNYIFPSALIHNENVTIINFHNALLPDYPGRNAPSWVIYNGDKETGITWHYVSEKIDAGDIIIQKKIAVSPNVRAYELAAQLMDMAYECFEECFDDVVSERVIRKKQICERDRRIYKSNEIPGNGCFEIDSKPEDIYRLLRAVDYGKYAVFPMPVCRYNGQSIRIKRYKVVDKEETNKENTIYIPFGDAFLMLRYEMPHAENE